MDQSGLITVFVVEDSPAIRTVLVQRIEDDPRFSVVGVAETSADAIGQLDKLTPDVTIIDLHLKQGTGYDILSRRNQLGLQSKNRMVVFTNYASASHRRHAMALGADAFFDKSMQFDEMLDALRIWADQRGQPPAARLS